ncbi:MAG TPA: NAD-dependent protein deacetylase [Gammaproteobacteria bacterium]|nr:NAD-dependent protein deacetylase [Gammaproteobacteria bacterium]
MGATVEQLAVESGAERLAAWCRGHRRLLVITGAGCSTESGIPDYRDANGAWKRRPPVQMRDFLMSETVRKRYWARSLLGWRHFSKARPNIAHQSLARLEAAGNVSHLITQNVDGLHQQAGSRRVTDLHGRLDEVMCLECGLRLPRARFQLELEANNPEWSPLSAGLAPDGDADLEAMDFSGFAVPACAACGGIQKPAVVFFGDAIPAERSRAALEEAEAADALLVVGSSLMVWSGFRLARAVAERRRPVAALNLGTTRADALLDLKVAAPCGPTLSGLVGLLGASEEPLGFMTNGPSPSR